MTPEIKTKLKELLRKRWEDYPSQDNEGFQPDFGDYKYGWNDGAQAGYALGVKAERERCADIVEMDLGCIDALRRVLNPTGDV